MSTRDHPFILLQTAANNCTCNTKYLKTISRISNTSVGSWEHCIHYSKCKYSCKLIYKQFQLHVLFNFNLLISWNLKITETSYIGCTKRGSSSFNNAFYDISIPAFTSGLCHIFTLSHFEISLPLDARDQHLRDIQKIQNNMELLFQ